MRYICTNCHYIYDEGIGDLEEGYESGIKLYDMKDYFSCPSCGEGIDSFMEIEEEINYFPDLHNLSKLEKGHFPIVKEKNGSIHVTVNHPSEENHFISSISLYDEYGDLVEEKFLEIGKKPEAEFIDYDLDIFEIRIRCNLHQTWSVGKISRE